MGRAARGSACEFTVKGTRRSYPEEDEEQVLFDMK